MCMVIQIAGQEDAGSGKRRNHAGAVQSDLLASDQHASGRKQNCAGAVQYGIQSGKNAVVGHTSYAAGTVLWRLATANPARNTKAANPANTAIEGHRSEEHTSELQSHSFISY